VVVERAGRAERVDPTLEVMLLLVLELGKAVVVVVVDGLLVVGLLETVGKEGGPAVAGVEGQRHYGNLDMAAPAEAAMQSSRCTSNRFSCASSNLFY
jgi:hypothetical protein